MSVGVFNALLEAIGGAGDTAAMNYLTSTAGLSTYIRAATEAGLSGRSALDAFRLAGGTVGNTLYWQLRSAVLASMNPLGPLGPGMHVAEELIKEWPGGREGVNQLNFRVYVQHTGADGRPFMATTNYSITQRELDVADAVDWMTSTMAQSNDPGDAYGRWVGFELVGIRKYTG